MKQPDCKGCTRRTLGCHSTCDAYTTWKQEREELAQCHRAEAEKYQYIREQRTKYLHKKHRSTRK